MPKSSITILKDDIEQRFLPFVRRPARYIGGEVNQVKKDLAGCDVKVALCFPDVYEIGMSNTGLAVIYEVLNRLDGVLAERVFAPWTDGEEIMRQESIPLFTLESRAAVADFDIIGFALTNEMCYTNMLNMLDLASLAFRSEDRSDDDPLIIVGGQAANCAEPIAPFVDIFFLGEGEEAIVSFVELYRQQKQAGASRRQLLLECARQFNFAYVPSLYDFEYDGEKITSFKAKEPDLPKRFENAVVDDFDNAAVPKAPIVPFARAVHERVSVEIMRGCPGRCRFCQASFCRRPIRYRSIDKICEIAKENYLATGFDTVSLLSLSTADYPDLEQLVLQLQEYFAPKRVGISLPSLRVGQQLKILPKLAASVRKSGLTIAVEAATERLRRVINKPISDADLFAAVEAAYEAGFGQVKLYFMVGLPGERQEDIAQIAALCSRIGRLGKKVANRTAKINAAVSWFVPKSHTPLAWSSQRDKEYFYQAKKLILDEKDRLKARFVQFKFHDIETSVLEAAFARGDRRMAKVVESAWQLGARFDLWSECFNAEIWQQAFQEHGMDINRCAQKTFAPDEILPWEHLGGPKKDYLLKHFNEAMNITEEEPG